MLHHSLYLSFNIIQLNLQTVCTLSAYQPMCLTQICVRCVEFCIREDLPRMVLALEFLKVILWSDYLIPLLLQIRQRLTGITPVFTLHLAIPFIKQRKLLSFAVTVVASELYYLEIVAAHPEAEYSCETVEMVLL